jgi:sulfoxide reductase heme-binding subunit YedZ
MSYLMPVQKFLAVHRRAVNNIFLTTELLIIALWLTVFFNALSDFRAIFLQVYNLGLTLGQTAIILYAITLTPGIITRLQWFPPVTQPISSLILPFRRHFGILMFLTAFLHLSFTTTLPYFAAHNFSPPNLLPELATFQWMGLFGWLALLPLWLTSNDYAQKGLGKFWKILHRLTYVALFFIFLHVALQGVKWMYVIAPFLILEVISWLVYWRREASKPKVVTPPSAPAAAPTTSPPTTLPPTQSL